MMPLCLLVSSEDGTRVIAAHSKHVNVFDSGKLSFFVDHTTHVRAAAFDRSGELLATAEDKIANVWRRSGPPARVSHRFPKRITGAAFAGERLLVSDKFGDVFTVPLDPTQQEKDEAAQAERDKQEAAAAEEKGKKAKKQKPRTVHTDEYECALGHCSVITCMAISACGTLLATGDRDERLRVSRVPQTFDIAAFCLGHTAFLAGTVFCGEWLASGAADGTLRMWHPREARCLATEHPEPESQTAVVFPCAYCASKRLLAVRVESVAAAWVYRVSAAGSLELVARVQTREAPLCLAFVAGGALVAGFGSAPVAEVVALPESVVAAADASSASALASAICAAAPPCEADAVAAIRKAYLLEPLRKHQGEEDDEEGGDKDDTPAPEDEEPEKKKPKKD